MKDRIELRPGVWIEVTPRLKKRLGYQHWEQVDVRDAFNFNPRKQKYPTAFLEELDRLAREIGVSAAAAKAGVSVMAIKSYRTRKALAEGKYKICDARSRYTVAQKQECVRRALRLMASTETKVVQYGRGRKYSKAIPKWSEKAAFAEAGRQLGVAGNRIHGAWAAGTIPNPQTSRFERKWGLPGAGAAQPATPASHAPSTSGG
jgi:hypothetical protein